MVKKIGIIICLIGCVMFIGCAGPYSGGVIFSDYSALNCSPDDANGLSLGTKTGKAQMVNYLGWIATGDASIEAAARAGGIKNIKTVDYHYDTILGIVSKTTTIVTGD